MFPKKLRAHSRTSTALQTQLMQATTPFRRASGRCVYLVRLHSFILTDCPATAWFCFLVAATAAADSVQKTACRYPSLHIPAAREQAPESPTGGAAGLRPRPCHKHHRHRAGFAGLLMFWILQASADDGIVILSGWSAFSIAISGYLGDQAIKLFVSMWNNLYGRNK